MPQYRQMRMTSMRRDIVNLPRTLIMLCLAFATLATVCLATAPVQLSGSGGQDILTQIASVNTSSQLTKASPDDLWNWGRIPYNYALNESSGKLLEIPVIDEENTWIGPVSSTMGLDTKEFT
jgi:hypothetical protein